MTKIVPESNREKPEKIITKARKVENTKKCWEKALRKIDLCHMFIKRLLKKIVISETILKEKELLKKKHAIIVQKFKLAHENR